MISLKGLLSEKEEKSPITEQPIGSYARYIKIALDRINQLVSNGALNKFTEAGDLIQIQTMLAQVEKAIEANDSDSNNNGFPDETEQDPELARSIRGYGQGRYQGD
jgi:hypothetical protein